MLEAAVAIKSLIFGSRNADKVMYGSSGTDDKGRIAATTGQLTNAAKSAAKLDNAIGKGAQAAIGAMNKVSKGSKILEYTAKGVDFASKNVNPLLIGAAGYRVLTSDDQAATLKKEILAMSGMFGVERLIKEGLETKYMKQVHAGENKYMKKLIAGMGNKYAKAVLAIIEGVGFVGGSILGYAGGQKVASMVVKPSKKKNLSSDINKIKEEITRLEKQIEPEKTEAVIKETKTTKEEKTPALTKLTEKNVMA